LMDRGQAVANMKPGIVGIQVKILKDVPADVSTKFKKIEGEKVEDKRSEEAEA